MNLNDVARLLKPKIIVSPANPSREITGGYASDLLSCVMAGAKAGNLWVTLQGHPNVIAVASLLDLAGVIVAEDSHIDEAAIQKAMEEDIPLYLSSLSTFAVVAKLAQAGLAEADM